MKQFSCLLLVAVFALTSCNPGSVSTSAFYEMPLKFLRKDANGKTFFEVYAKGRNEKECRLNAKKDVARTLIYEGVRQGVSLPPILATPALEKKFRAKEERFLENLIDNNNLVFARLVNQNKLQQSSSRKSQLSMPFEVGVDHRLLESEVLKAIK